MISDNLKKRLITSLALFILVILIFNSNFIMVYSLILILVFSILEFLNITKKTIKKKFILFVSNAFFILYVFTICSAFIYFSNIISLKIIFFIILMGCIASDIGGFIFGKIFKGPKLTKISPNKTYAGAVGSLIFSIMIVSSFFILFFNLNNFYIIITGFVISIFCQLGDLLFSFLKRKAKIKDTGNILPGHGGILDRLDGVLLGIPAGFVSVMMIS